MAEDFDTYRARVLSYLGDRDPLAVLRATPDQLRALVTGRDADALGRRPSPNKWSVLEIIAHMGDAELAMGWRVRNCIATPGVTLPWFDQDLWSVALSYERRDVTAELEQFGALRAGTLAVLAGVPRATWKDAYGVHEVRGKQTVDDFVCMEAAHDLNHLLQIEAILERGPEPC